jgi:hypothetical protein
VILYRLFSWDGHAREAEEGGPFYVPRLAQGQGRHDIPERDGVFYASLNALSAVAEWVQFFRGREVTPDHFKLASGRVKALATLTLSDKSPLVNLDDPKILVDCDIRPSEIITHNRNVTRLISSRLFDAGYPGFLWPSSLEGAWINATLFQSRVQTSLTLTGDIRPLELSMPEVQEAAAFFGIDVNE